MYPHGLSQKEESELLKEIEGFFEEVGAKQIAKDLWGQRGLAYPVKGHTEAHFVIYYYDLDPAKLKEVDQALRIAKGVIRHLIVKPPKNYQIVKYSEAYAEWLKTRESVDDVRAREKEEKVKEQVARKAKRQAEKTSERKKTDEDRGELQEEQLSKKLEELISDDSLDI
jgi:ribosomal protein S6